MKVDTATADAREALLDFQRYLADEIAPMMAAHAAKVLMGMPPNYGVEAIERWLQSQLSSPNQAVTVSRYLYHAVKKIHHFSEVNLVDQRVASRYLADLSPLVVRLCPEREQAELLAKLSRIGESTTTLDNPVRLLNREVGNEAEEQQIKRARRQQANADPSRADRQVALPVSPRRTALMGRLRQLHGSEQDGPTGQETQEILARLVGKSAVDAGDPAQFDACLEQIRQSGVEPKLDQVFRVLAERLPGWDVEPRPLQLGGDVAVGRLLQAMHKIVALASSPEEGIQRFSEMVYAAIEQFNEGHLAQAVAMFDVAQGLIEEKKVDADTAGLVRSRAQSSVSTASLRQFASAPPKHGLLRKVLCFFQAFAPESLLQTLDGEPKREKRKLMLSLIEVHGPPCRPKLLDRLASYVSGELPDEQRFYSRNIVFLLRRIPHRAEDDQLRELKLLAELSRPGTPFMVAKEAVGSLAQLSVPKTEQVLIERLTGFEQEALSREPAYDREEMLEILDRTCAALAHLGTPKAMSHVVNHAYRKESQLGDTLRRVQHLSVCDLVQDYEQLERLVETLWKMLPTKVLGVVLGRRAGKVSHLIRGLSGTRDPRVRSLFQEIARNFKGQEFAEQARQALALQQSKPATGGEAPETLSGDLEIFGLPTLLQSMADSELSGRLVISEPNGCDRAVIVFSGGKILRCEVGRLRGLDAMCQLFERPRSACFVFQKAAPNDAVPREEGVLDVMSTILEAMRRHDEFNEDRALVPDGISLMPGEATPSLPKQETDKEFAKSVWSEAARGTAPETCEGAVDGDAYRVRKLYAHWLESGALERRPAA